MKDSISTQDVLIKLEGLFRRYDLIEKGDTIFRGERQQRKLDEISFACEMFAELLEEDLPTLYNNWKEKK
jgi:hypothetical protein